MHIVSWLKKTFLFAIYEFQQDGAASHEAKKTQQFLKENKANFCTKDFWPSSCIDLNPLDHSIWNVVESRASKKPHSILRSLKSSITRA